MPDDAAAYKEETRRDIAQCGLEAYVVEMMWILAQTVESLKDLTLALRPLFSPSGETEQSSGETEQAAE